MKHIGLYLLLFFSFTLIASDNMLADDLPGITYLSPKKFEQSDLKLIWLTDNWLYHAGDDTSWASSDFDDSNWESINPAINLRAPYPKDGWKGNGWFRLHLKVDSTFQNEPLGIRLRHFGASEIFLDGKRLFKFGIVGKNAQEEKRFYPQYPRTVIFSGEDHVIAVRYSNHSQSEYVRNFGNVGFSMNIGHIDDAIAVKLWWSVRYKTYMFIIMVSSLLLAMFHIILFIYNPKQKLNLYLSLLSASFAAQALFTFQNHFTSDPDLLVLFNQLKVFTSVALVLLQLLTIYKLFYRKLPKSFFFFLGYGAVVVFMLVTASSSLKMAGDMFMMVGFAEGVRVGIMKGLKRKGGYRIIVAGSIILFLFVVYQLLINFQIVKPIGGIFLVYIYGFLAFLVSLSAFLALQFAQTSRKLEHQLIHARELSEKMLEQERIAKEQEITRRLLEADNKRKTAELEEARELQLSMLPKNIPEVANLDIAAYMKTANEVGGDYYDFCMGTDGTLTVALGDATSHGMKAGLMVSLIKSLFLADAPSMDMISFLGKCSKTIRKMELGNLYMSMLLLKINDSQITTTAAGMPPILIYRNQERRVEELTIKGLPLGGPKGSAYREFNQKVTAGDTILLMSDGFPELFNEEMEMLDYNRTKKIFEEAAQRSPNEIITHLREAAEQWLNGKPQDDDITFVVLRFK